MAAAEAYRKVVIFLIVAASILLAVFLLSVFEELGRTYLIGTGSFAIDAQNNLVVREGAAPGMMTVTSISLVENVLHVVKILLWMGFVVVVVRLVTRLLFETVLRAAAHSEIASLAKTVLSIIIYIVAFFIIFQSQYPRIELAPLFTGSAILGIVVGLALQDTLGNLFAGIALQADQPFQVGDVITISNRGVGVVESVSWRGVRIRTFQNKLLVISNAVLGKETIEVAPQGNLNARLVYFNTIYTDSPAKTSQVVRDAIRGLENISQKIRPIIRIRDLGDHGLDWEIKYWTDNYAKYNEIDAAIRQRIWYAFQREGLSLAFPTRTIHMETVPEPVPVEEQVMTKSEYLERVPIFGPLSDEEIARLAKAAIRRIFAPGEMIVRKGQDGSSMYIVVRGSVKVQLAERSTVRTVGQLGPADFFGEMSLLTGEPRTANVVADEETEVLQIRKSAIKHLFDANPGLLESISKIVDERRVTLSETELLQTMHPTKEHTGMISAIRKFFGIGENG